MNILVCVFNALGNSGMAQGMEALSLVLPHRNPYTATAIRDH